MKLFQLDSYQNFEAKERGSRLISPSFFRELSKTVTKWAIEVTAVEEITEIADIKMEYFDRVSYVDEYGIMRIEIMTKSALVLADRLYVVWKHPEKIRIIKPDEDIKAKDICFEIKAKKEVVEHFIMSVKLYYRPVVKKEQSGLEFDYQIRNDSECPTYRVYFADIVCEDSLIKFKAIVSAFASVHPMLIEIKKTSPKAIKSVLDYGGNLEPDIHMLFMKGLCGKGLAIKKVVIV